MAIIVGYQLAMRVFMAPRPMVAFKSFKNTLHQIYMKIKRIESMTVQTSGQIFLGRYSKAYPKKYFALK